MTFNAYIGSYLKENETDNVRMKQHSGTFRNHCCCGKAVSITYWSVCVRACECTGSGVCFRACSLTYPACNAHASHCLRPIWLHIFRHNLINDMIFRKTLLNIKFVLICSTTLSETFLILRRIQRGIDINVKTSSCKISVIIVEF